MPSRKVYLNKELDEMFAKKCAEKGFGSISQTLVYYARLGLDTTPIRPQYDPITTPSTRESIKREKVSEKKSNVGRVASDPITTLNEKQLAIKPMVLELILMIRKASGKDKYNRNETKCVKVVEQLIRIDGVPQADVKPALAWGLESQFWGKLINSIPFWRRNTSGESKFWNVWTKWKEANDPVKKMTSKEYYDQNEHKVKPRKTRLDWGKVYEVWKKDEAAAVKHVQKFYRQAPELAEEIRNNFTAIADKLGIGSLDEIVAEQARSKT